MKYAVVTSTSGIQHSIMAGQDIRRVPKDEQGRTMYATVCGRVIHGPLSAVDDLSTIRCRRCKGRLDKSSFPPKRAER